jgi:hypothetical protein
MDHAGIFLAFYVGSSNRAFPGISGDFRQFGRLPGNVATFIQAFSVFLGSFPAFSGVFPASFQAFKTERPSIRHWHYGQFYGHYPSGPTAVVALEVERGGAARVLLVVVALDPHVGVLGARPHRVSHPVELFHAVVAQVEIDSKF